MTKGNKIKLGKTDPKENIKDLIRIVLFFMIKFEESRKNNSKINLILSRKNSEDQRLVNNATALSEFETGFADESKRPMNSSESNPE